MKPAWKTVWLGGSLSGLLLAACGGGAGGGGAGDGTATRVAPAGAVRVVPAESDDVLLNPGKGWVLYGGFEVKSDAAWRLASTCYRRLTWAELQPAVDVYDWRSLDQDIALCKARGKQFAFGVMPANSLSGQPVAPAWLYEQGAASYTGSDGRTYPVWSDPVYLRYQQRLTATLAARFDGSEDIAYIDARSYGNFGEWHLTGIGGPVPSEAVQRQLLDIWAAFKQTDIMVPGDSSTYHVQYATGTLGLGLRYDSSDYAALTAAGALAKNVAPAVSEWSTRYAGLKTGSGWTGQVWRDDWIPAYMAASGYSYDNLGQWDADTDLFLAEKPALARTWANRMGYWFRLAEATYPAHLGNGQAGTLSLAVRNDGVAPIFVNKRGSVVKLALLDANQQVVGTPVLLAGVHPFDWQPGTTVSASADFAFPATPGAQVLAIGLFSRASRADPDVRFGNQGHTAQGWLVLGTGL